MSSRWLFSTVGKRSYVADYFRAAEPGIFIVGSGNTPFTPGFTACDKGVVVPDIGSNGYLEHVLDLVETERLENVLIFSDLDVTSIALIRPELTERGVRCFFPGEELATRAADKHAMVTWARNNGFNAPLSALELADLPRASTIDTKPRFGSASQGVTIGPAEEAHEAAKRCEDPIYQEYIAGTEVNLEILGDLDGEPVRCSVWRKYRSVNGETALSQTVRDEELIEYARILGSALRLVGPNDVDLIRAEDGDIYLIEVNTRFGGGYPVSQLAGAGFPEALLQMTRGESVEWDDSFDDGVWMMKTLQPFGGTHSLMADALNVDVLGNPH